MRTARNYSNQRYPPKAQPLSRARHASLQREGGQHPFLAGRSSRSGQRESAKAREIKEFIDHYFQETPNQYSRMPIIKRKSSLKADSEFSMDRKNRLQRGEEDLTKSVPLGQGEQAQLDIAAPPSLLRWSVSSMQRQLPSIHEQKEGNEEKEQECQVLNLTSKLSFLKRTSSMFSDYANPEGPEEDKVCTFQNELFYIFVVKKEGRVVARAKQFKEKGFPFMQKEVKMKNYGIVSLWKESRYNHYSFLISPRPPIKDMLAKIMPDEVTHSQMKIKQRPLHSKLLANHSQELSLLLRNFCVELLKVEGKVLNNKINPSNLFLRSSGIQLAEWGYASFRDQFTIRENRFEKRRYGVLKGDKDWFVSPEYLAPQIIRQLLGDDEGDIWQSKGSPDVWSLGITFFELMTLIPVWMPSKCSLIHRPAIVRSGILHCHNRDLQLLLKKQLGVQRVVRNLLAAELLQCEQSDKLLQVIVRMVQPDSRRRISLQQIIGCL